MAEGLQDAWRRAIDANLRYYGAWSSLVEDYVRDLGNVLKDNAPAVRLPSFTVPGVVPPADPGAARQPPPPGRLPAVVLEGPPGATVQGAVLVQNHLPHPVTAAVDVRMDTAGPQVIVEPAAVTLAPGETTVVRITATVPDDPAAPESSGRVLVPELVGTAVPVVVRTRLDPAGGGR
ncbi:hypothetical protein [Actinoplanes sp. GCM10030250]|uniref:hypothetical protein n=1 Tax=Actinoplanes sp. GCM10030250 TaxID=3273376 RepID=UPI003611F781